MSRGITEQIDDICEERFGHTNWVIISTLSDQEKVGLDDVADIETVEGVPVAFYFDETLEKSIELIDNLISDIYKENGYEDYAQKIIGAWINIKEKLEEKDDE